MVTEEIIIDGINVAGCKYYHYKGCTANNLCKCGNSINCYYKQLKRLEQFTMMHRIVQNERRTRSHRDLCTNITKKYRSVLEEIKEIVSDEIDKTDSDDKLIQIYGTIYNKINEVLVK